MIGRWFACLGGVLVVFVVGATVAHQLPKNTIWTPDGYFYARMMLVDTGMSKDAARVEVSRFYQTTSEGRNPESPDFYTSRSPDWFEAQYPIFRARVLYPWLAAKLYPHFGYRALRIVPAIGVVVAAGVFYVLLLLVAPWWLGACGAIAGTAAFDSAVFLPLTDGVAVAWWIVTLAAIAVYARNPSRTALAVSVVGAVLLGVTRPAYWLPIGAAAGLFVAAYRSADAPRLRSAWAMLGSQLAVALAGLAFTAAVHGAGFFTLLNWSYTWHQRIHGPFLGHGIALWYLQGLAYDLVTEPGALIEHGIPLLFIVSAAVGFAVRRRDPIVPVLIGVACVAPLAIAVNPSDFRRALEIPMVPVVMTGMIAAIAVAVRAARSGAGSQGGTG